MSFRYWIIAAIACVILEILPPSTHFYFLCLTLGAIGGAVASYFSAPVWVEWAVFAVVSLASIPVLVPLARFLFASKHVPPNAEEVVGQDAVVLEAVDVKGKGTVRVGGELWRAVSEDGPHAKDDTVRVLRVEGTHVIVKRNP